MEQIVPAHQPLSSSTTMVARKAVRVSPLVIQQTCKKEICSVDTFHNQKCCHFDFLGTLCSDRPELSPNGRESSPHTWEYLEEIIVSLNNRLSQIVFQKFIGKLEVCFPPIHPGRAKAY